MSYKDKDEKTWNLSETYLKSVACGQNPAVLRQIFNIGVLKIWWVQCTKMTQFMWYLVTGN